MQILGTSEIIQQGLDIRVTNANIRYIRGYTTIFRCIRDKIQLWGTSEDIITYWVYQRKMQIFNTSEKKAIIGYINN